MDFSYFYAMLGSLFIVIIFFVLCFFAGRFLLYDMWFTRDEPTFSREYDPEYEEYRDFLDSMKKDLEKDDITLR